ncbi:hypothetical protein [Chitinophaga sancti]|uniref:hypothetical protein n=1 Tax=Chitinophaga sancti TaxID=1004 RepID=UPI003F7A9A41
MLKIKENETPLSEEAIVKIKEYRYDFLKFFLGTFIIGVAGIITTCIYKGYELKIASRQTENQYLNSYITQYNNLYTSDSLGKYDKIAEMFEVLSIATTDADMQMRWDSLRRYFQGKIQVITDSIGRYKDSVSVVSIKVDSFKQAQQDLEVKISTLAKANPDGNAAKIEKLQVQQEQLRDSVSTRQLQLNRFASIKLNAEKYAIERMIHPPTSLPAPEKNYEIVYDLDRYTALGNTSEIIEGIAVRVNSINEQTGAISLTIDRNDHNAQTMELKAGASTPMLTFGDDSFQVKVTMKSCEAHIMPGKKVAKYQVIVQKLKA